jgi:Mn-dependent DtxR family transcriptional regulator
LIEFLGGIGMDAVELVVKVLSESKEPLKSGEIAEKAGIDKKLVDKAIKELKKEEKIESPKRCYYTLKK